MSCLCRFFTSERAEAAGLPRDYFEGKVCMECARSPSRRFIKELDKLGFFGSTNDERVRYLLRYVEANAARRSA